MKEEEKQMLEKISKVPDIIPEEVNRLKRIFEEDDVKKSLKQIMKKYNYTTDELKELLHEMGD